MKKLPVGLSNLTEIIRNGYIYVDKTRFVAELANNGKYYFLARPRRFGKTLFVDTLKQAFSCNEKLFHGLYLEKNWNWSKKYPVIHLSFGKSGAYNSEKVLLELISNTIAQHAAMYGLQIESKEYSLQFNELIEKMSKQVHSPVVLLVDEYDKPILDVIENREQAMINREILKGLYAVIKDNDEYLRFVFLTGVSKFSKVSLFSGLNNLEDITLNGGVADICGYTQGELETCFTEYLQAGSVKLAKLKAWYNGYNYIGSEQQKVYNPFDILLFFKNACQYKNYWFETATPTFLIKLLSAQRYSHLALEGMTVMEDSLSCFDVDDIPLSTLMFQTGYLTVTEQVMIGSMPGYKMSYPNLEVKASVNSHLARVGTDLESSSRNLLGLARAIEDGDTDKLCDTITAMFSAIPYQWYRNNPISEYEGFYASVLYSYISALGYTTRAEDATNAGSIDISVDCGKNIIVLELKLSKYGTADEALAQIINKRYAEKFVGSGKTVYLLGISFDGFKRNVEGFAVKILH